MNAACSMSTRRRRRMISSNFTPRSTWSAPYPAAPAPAAAAILVACLWRHSRSHGGTPGKSKAKNMPGAGSFLAVNTVYSVSPKDGTVIALGAPTMALDERIGTTGVRFKSAELNWVGRIDSQIDVLFMSGKSRVKTIDDARTME